MRIGLASLILAVIGASAQSQDESRKPAVPWRSAYVIHLIEQAVRNNPLPAGFKGMKIGYLDDFGPVYKAYGIATENGTVAINEKTVFGIGSGTKTFTATLLAIADTQGLPLATPARSLLPSTITIPAGANRYDIQLLDLADHHGGLPKNEGHLYNVLNDLYGYYAADPITCDPQPRSSFTIAAAATRSTCRSWASRRRAVLAFPAPCTLAPLTRPPRAPRVGSTAISDSRSWAMLWLPGWDTRTGMRPTCKRSRFR
jgi:CubicO group peptidase (beta-lactamase class C family)